MKLILLITILLIAILSASTSSAQPRRLITYSYDGGGAQADNFYDGYACADGGYIFCGSANRAQDGSCWIMRTDSQGDPIWRMVDNYPQRPDQLRSVIECDDGGVIAAGSVSQPANENNVFEDDIRVIRCNADGDTLWTRLFDNGDTDNSYAIIELKSGDYVVAGFTNSMGAGRNDGYLLWLNDEGDRIRHRTYGTNQGEIFYALRETDGGILAAGTHTQLDGQRDKNFWLVKVNFNGQELWAREFGDDEYDESLSGMATVPGDGYVLCGTRLGPNGTEFMLVKVDMNGGHEWTQHYIVNGENALCTGVASIAGSGFALGGYDYAINAPRVRSLIIRTRSDGDENWRRLIPSDTVGSVNSLASIISLRNGSIMGIGQITNQATSGDGMAVLTSPERSAPEIIDWHPEILELDVLIDDIVTFWIQADDLQDDSLRFSWLYEEQVVSENDTATVMFGDFGEFDVRCLVSDGDQGDSIRWHVTVTDLYILSFTPDTLALAIRRGQSVDFSLDTVRAVPGDPVEYLWLKRNMDAMEEVDTVGLESDATVEFQQSGHYRVDGIAYRGESSDMVSWDVSVRGAIWAFAPEDLVFEVLPDSIVSFVVEPTSPNAEGQRVQWLIDGEVAAEDTTNFEWQFTDRFGNLSYQVQVVVADTVESDTVTWAVMVVEPDWIDGQDARPTRVELLTVSPNPFNSTLTIRYQSVKSVQSVVNIFDLSGRLVADLSNSAFRSPRSAFGNVIWDASAVPAGVYFVRLQSGRVVATKKVVLMR